MWSYTPSSGLPRDAVRRMIGDTLPSDQQIQDEEIDAILGSRATIYGAAADACRAIAAKFSRSVTQSGGGSAMAAFSDLSKAYLRMAVSFEARSFSYVAMPYAAIQTNDCPPPDQQFSVGFEDNYIPLPAQSPTEQR